MKTIVGCGTALVTPFLANNAVDYVRYRQLVQRQVRAGIDFLVALGTTAEAACLTLEEKKRLVEITLEEAGQTPVFLGVGTNCTTQVVENIQFFDAMQGHDGYLVVAPYYNKPNQRGLLAHYQAIASATDQQIILYNIPGRTAINIEADTVLKLSKQCANIIAIKEASANYGQISKIIEKAPVSFSVLSGNDDDTLPLMSLGATGVISTVANLVPKTMVKLVKACLNDDFKLAHQLHYQMKDLFTYCFRDTNPQPIKGAMAKLGLLANFFRLPMVAADPELVDQIIKSFEQINE